MTKLMKKSKRGFTLVELVIVIAILAIVAAIAIPTASNVIGNANKAADSANAQAIEMAIKSCQSEYAAQGTTPSSIITTLFGATPNGTPVSGQTTLKQLLAAYGVDSSILASLKQDAAKGFKFDSTTGKVTTDGTTGASGNSLTENSTYVITDGKIVITRVV